MYLVLNNEIGLTTGQACAQASHITQVIVEDIIRDTYECVSLPDYCASYVAWSENPVCIVKGAPTAKLLELKDLPFTKCYYDDVFNKKTQTKTNHITAVGFYPGHCDRKFVDDLDLM